MNPKEKARRMLEFLEKKSDVGFSYSEPLRALLSCLLSQRTRDANAGRASDRAYASL